MASFSRGLFLPGLRQSFSSRAILPELPVFKSRFFSTGTRLCAAAPKAPKSPASRVPKPTLSKTGIAPSRYAFIKSLATKPTPTMLYEAPSHFWFYFGCWSSGLFLLGWTALTARTTMDQPEGVAPWVGYVFGFCYVLLVAMAFFLLSKTPNVVQTIRLVPRQAAASATGASSTVNGQAQLEVTVKSMVPFMRSKVVTADLDKVAMQSRFSLPEEFVPELKRLELKRQQEEAKKALWKFDMEHILTMPFRRVGRVIRRIFVGMRSAWTDMGFGVIEVNGKAYKVDVTEGYAHDGFRTLEKLVQ